MLEHNALTNRKPRALVTRTWRHLAFLNLVGLSGSLTGGAPKVVDDNLSLGEPDRQQDSVPRRTMRPPARPFHDPTVPSESSVVLSTVEDALIAYYIPSVNSLGCVKTQYLSSGVKIRIPSLRRFKPIVGCRVGNRAWSSVPLTTLVGKVKRANPP